MDLPLVTGEMAVPGELNDPSLGDGEPPSDLECRDEDPLIFGLPDPDPTCNIFSS